MGWKQGRCRAELIGLVVAVLGFGVIDGRMLVRFGSGPSVVVVMVVGRFVVRQQLVGEAVQRLRRRAASSRQRHQPGGDQRFPAEPSHQANLVRCGRAASG